MKIQFFLISCVLLLAAPVFAQSPDCHEVDRVKMAKMLGAPDLAGALSVEAASCNDLLLGEGVGFRLSNETSQVYGGTRSEVAVDFPFLEGEIIRYTWEMKIPTDLKGDEPLNRWWLLSQWHDQPDRRINEKWDGFPVRSPPVAIFMEIHNGSPGIGVIMNGRDKRSWHKVALGVWLKVSMTLHWSTKDDGEAEFHIAGYPEFDLKVKGGNMHNSYQHYLKFGQYRHSKIKTDSIIYFKKLSIEKIASGSGSTSERRVPNKNTLEKNALKENN
ncbi:heparin lyase I family protein [Undibacterium sp. Ren11W]|uniref:heparin lyase I family protein n=1 Tax=Undibacterium sp. Ren11W TaxID=3413045 RepID=UPI003BF2AD13